MLEETSRPIRMSRRGFLQSAGAGVAGAGMLLAEGARQPVAAKPETEFNGQLIEGAGGVKLYVERAGSLSKPPILFIHGFSQCRLSWDPQFTSDLASKFYVVRMDIRGHGASDKPRDLAAYQNGKNWADDVDAVIRTFRLKRPVLVGWSYGGFIISDYVRHYGQQGIGGINFVDAATEIGSDEAARMLGPEFVPLFPGLLSDNAVDSMTALQSFVRMLTHEPVPARDFYFYLGFNAAVPAYVRQGLAQRKLDNTDVLKSLTVPVLITQGRDDKIVLPAAADHIARQVPNAKRATYVQCGHAPFLEVAQPYNQDLAEFVEAARPRQG